ncbi:anti-CBASS protein Acb1 family protein [Halomarina salina]|uniref:Anti-CBASS protein Acb1 family protein n=1 Tax=Halomarina salina TaxID=1872699 RepID=A0ABD5RHP2_9EURY|nr:anti-CBASS Acb1 family protein [Halomarina salina]
MAIEHSEDGDGPTRDDFGGLRNRAVLAAALGIAYGGKRDYYDNFAWDRSPDIEDYYASFLRNPHANAVISIPAETAWRNPPEYVDEKNTEAGTDTDFESDMSDVVSSTRLWHYCKRAHLLSRIGQFGLLMIGWADGEDQQFVDPVDQSAVAQNDPGDAIEWLRPLSQISVTDIRWADANSGRWGQPEYYRIDFSDENDAGTEDIFGAGQREQWVHHSRVIHIAGGLLDDEVRGTPALEPVYNTVTDLQKLEGSAAEAAYSIARPGLHINVDKDANLNDDAEDQIDAETDAYVNEFQPMMRTQGVEVNRIAGEQIDPEKVKQALIESLSEATKIPQKILKGNESGEVAGAQDLREFYGAVAELIEQVCDPQIVRELADRLVKYQVVTGPAGGDYSIDREPLAEQDEQEQSEIQENRSTVIKNIAQYAPGLDTKAIVEFIEEGEFPEMDESQQPAPMNPAEDAGAPPPNATPPALADGGEEQDGTGDDG